MKLHLVYLVGFLWSSVCAMQSTAATGHLDLDFNPYITAGTDVPGSIRCIAVQPDGKILISGYFTAVDGVPRNHIARLNEDGSLDTDFVPGTVANPGANDGAVTALAVLPSGLILAGGSFNNFGGAVRPYFVALNEDGSVSANTVTFNTQLVAITVQKDGKWLAGGSFETVNGAACAHVSRINTDFSRDTTFTSPFTYGNHVAGIALDSQDRVYLTGQTTFVSGPITRVGIIRLDSTGAIDTSFNANLPASTHVYSVAADRENRIIMGYPAGSPGRYLRLTSAGTADPSFTFVPAHGAYSLALQADGKALFGEGFGPVPLFPGVARTSSEGIMESAPDFDIGTGANSSVSAVTLQADGKVLIGGTFYQFNGESRFGLARLLSDAPVESLTVQGTSRIEWLRGGTVPEVSGTSFELSTDNGTTWSLLGYGTRIEEGWELDGLNFSVAGKIRARGFVNVGGYGDFFGTGSSIVEATEDFVLPVSVPGSANLWLAGHPDGTTALDSDVAPSESPVLAPVTLVAGQDLQFAVTGGTHNGPVLPDPEDATGPDGGDAAVHSAENRIASLNAPLNALVGVFLDNDEPSGAAPGSYLDFSNPAFQELEIIEPGLRQPFFIGNGKTSGLTNQRVRIPPGATRLFLGSLDTYTNNGNAGAFSVATTAVAPIPISELPAATDFSILRGNGTLPWTITIQQASEVAGLTVRVESTLTPDEEDSWADLPGGSLLQRDGSSWSLAALQIPTGLRYFRIVMEAPGFAPQVAQFPSSFVVERQTIDTTPPTLTITHAWVQKIAGKTTFRMMLDPQDEMGFAPIPGKTIEFRSKLNSTAPLPANTPWNVMPWSRGAPFDLPFNCSSIVIEIRAVDAAGNESPLQRRTFKTPFPYSNPPNVEPRLASIIPFNENAISCVGLFAADFDGQGTGDDLLQIDQVSGEVRVRRQNGGAFTDNSFNLPPGSVTDSAIGDFDRDGLPDLVVISDNTVKVLHNDGLDGGGFLQFSESAVPGLTISSLTTINHCAVGDMTGDGKDDVVVTGTDSGGAPRIAILINYLATGELQTATSTAMATGTDPGSVRVGDVNGDGWLDAVVADTMQNQVIVFLNKGDQTLGGDGETNPDYQPRTAATGHQFQSLPPKAITVGDVTGDGRADVVAVMHWFVSTNGSDPNDTRDHQVWQLLDAQPDGSLEANALYPGSSGPQAASGTDFHSDVMLLDLNGDRFPEIVFTSQFQAPAVGGTRQGGVKVIKLVPQLTATNTLQSFDFTEIILATDSGNPHRLAAGRYGSRTKRDIVLANASNPQLQWLLNSYTPLAKTLDLVGGASTESDPDGTELPNGAVTYVEYPGGTIDYTLTYANNSVNPLTNATIEILLPSTLVFQPRDSDPGHVIVNSGTSHIIRWTETIPPGGAGVKNLRARVATTAKKGLVLSPKSTLKGGGKKISVPMPKVTIGEPLTFEFVKVESDTDASGKTARFNDTLHWFMKATNRGPTPITNAVITMNTPSGTKLSGPVAALPGIVYTVPNSATKKITFTISTLAPGQSTSDLLAPADLQVYADVSTENTAARIAATATLQRPSGTLIKLPTFYTDVEPPVQVEVTPDKLPGPDGIISYSPGELIEYTVKITNNGGAPLGQARVINVIPRGTKLVGARLITAGDNFTGPEEETAQLDLDTLNGDRPAYVRGATPYLYWVFNNPIPSDEHRLMKYRVKVGADVPLDYYDTAFKQFASVQVRNDQFNAVGVLATTPYPTTVLSYQTANDTAAKKADAAIATLLPKNSTVYGSAVRITTGNAAIPSLNLRKFPLGKRDDTLPPGDFKYPQLPSERKGADYLYHLIQSRSNAADGVFSYMLRAENRGNSKATNLYIHDVLPANAEFQGVIYKNESAVGSLDLFHFYDAKGVEIPNFDYSKNHLVRSFELFAGDLPYGGNVSFFYQVKLKGEPAAGTPILSTSGGVAGTLAKSTGGLLYNQKPGYHLTCEDLHFPVNGEPDSITIQTADAVTTSFPVAPMLSRDELSDGASSSPPAAPMPIHAPFSAGSTYAGVMSTSSDEETLEICIPYEITGNPGLEIRGSKMTFDIPKGYEVLGVRVLDDAPKVINKWIKSGYERQTSSTWVGDHTGGSTITVTVKSSGVTSVTIPLNDPTLTNPPDFRICCPLVHLRFNPNTVSALRDKTSGFTTKDLGFLPVISGGRYNNGELVPPASTEVVCAARTDTTKDGKVFVGRCAPMSVEPGKTFRYTIFVGNLSENDLGQGYIKMRVPAGCRAKKATSYIYNGLDQYQNEVGMTNTSIKPSGKAVRISATEGYEVTWPNPLPANTLIVWSMGSFYNSEAGVVTVEMEVDPNYKGNSIQDDSCVLEVANAPDKTPGPLAVVVRKGDVLTEAAKTVQGVLEGMGMQYTTEAGDIIAQDFVMGSSAATITFGAANVLQLKPNAYGKCATIVGLPKDRVFVIGHPDSLDAYQDRGRRVLLDETKLGLMIVVGPGTASRVDGVEIPDGIVLLNPPGKPSGSYPANRLLNELPNVNLSVISRELATFYVGNSGNGTAIRSGTNHHGIKAVPVLLPARVRAEGTFEPAVPLDQITRFVGPAAVLSGNSNAIVAAGGGNVVVLPGGAIVAAGGGNVLSNDGAGVVSNDGAGIVAAGGGNVLSHNGNAIVAAGGGNIVAAGGGNIVAAGGGNIVAAGGGNIMSQGK